MKLKHTLTEIVKGTDAMMTHICDHIVYYNIQVEDSLYQLGIDCTEDEWKSTDLYPRFKAITLMRWIKRSIENNTLVQIK